MGFNIYNTYDIIDIRDVIERYEEIKNHLEDLTGKDAGDFGSFEIWIEFAKENQSLYDLPSVEFDEIIDELLQTYKLMNQLRGYGGDEQWEGDWYPIHLIHENYFTDYAQQLVEDVGDIPNDLPWYIKSNIDWAGVASEIKNDYSEIIFNNETYYYR